MMMLINTAGDGGNTVQQLNQQWDSLTIENPSSIYNHSSTNAIIDDYSSDDYDALVDAFSCDHFRMLEFKVRKCARGRSHDWTECPFAHPGEKARRRDPRKFLYSGTPCPEFKKGGCKKGDSCEYAHGVFECWLHPSRYRTQPCKDGVHCRRRICFFAHTPEQLRVLSPSQGGGSRNNNNHNSGAESYDGSPSRLSFDSFNYNNGGSGSFSPPSSWSPPMSPIGSLSHNSVSELACSIRGLQIGAGGGGGMNSTRLSMSPPSWGGSSQMGSGFSPRSPSTLRPGFMSLPSTPIPTRSSGFGAFDLWDPTCNEEPVMERVESGRDLRARIYAKLSRENSLGRVDSSTQYPDFGWVSELVK